MNKKIKIIIEIVLIGIIVFIVSNYFFQICFVKGNSMMPTLKNGQVLISKKYNLQIKNNDIIVIKKNNKTIIKRVIGIPNDEIAILEGYIYLNGNKFDDIYTENSGILTHEIKLKDDEYFVLGDNRNASIDSRFDEIGIINKKEIIAKIILY